jgi:hypothetical protein
MTFNTKESTVMKIGQDQQGHYEMIIGTDGNRKKGQ